MDAELERCEGEVCSHCEKPIKEKQAHMHFRNGVIKHSIPDECAPPKNVMTNGR